MNFGVLFWVYLNCGPYCEIGKFQFKFKVSHLFCIFLLDWFWCVCVLWMRVYDFFFVCMESFEDPVFFSTWICYSSPIDANNRPTKKNRRRKEHWTVLSGAEEQERSKKTRTAQSESDSLMVIHFSVVFQVIVSVESNWLCAPLRLKCATNDKGTSIVSTRCPN